ncbi:MAG: hypothetical protein QXL50_01825 [Candidatus Pacearchaeota archaeon]
MENASIAKQKFMVFGIKFLFIFLFIFLYLRNSFALNINEINFNPINQTYEDEYIELYAYENFNLSNFLICDLVKCNNLTLYKFVNSNYFLITTNKSNYLNVNATIYVVNGTRIGNGLNNDGDCIFLYYSNLLVDFVCYNKSVDKGNSLQLINLKWQECKITPGEENYCEQEENFSIEIPKNILNKNKEFVVLIDAKDKTKLYDVKIDIITNDSNERLSQIYYNNSWRSTYYYIYSVNLSNKTFILRINSNYNGLAIAEIKIKNIVNYFFPVNIVNFSIKEETNENISNISYLEILDYPENCEEEDIIKVKLKVYRGNTRKYAVYVYIYDEENNKEISEKTIFYANEKFKEYVFTLPIKINEINSSKNYILIAEGLDKVDKKEIFIKDKYKTQEKPKYYEEKNKEENEEEKWLNFSNFDIYFYFNNYIYDDLILKVKIKNKDKDKNFYLWSYVYSNDECISCENSKDENYVKVFINQNEIVELNLYDKIIKNFYGYSKLKINVLQEDGQLNEFDFNVFINKKEEVKEIKVKKIIYESKTIKNSEKIIYFLVFLVLFLILLIIFKKL